MQCDINLVGGPVKLIKGKLVAVAPGQPPEPYTTLVGDLAWNRRPQHRYRCSGASELAALGKVKCASGTIQYKAYCLECGGKGTNFPYSDVAGLDESRIPIISEHDVTPCERCGSDEGSEAHHWAPIHLFEDADDWPMSHLCRKCHLEWHAKVTPLMSTKRNGKSRNREFANAA